MFCPGERREGSAARHWPVQAPRPGQSGRRRAIQTLGARRSWRCARLRSSRSAAGPSQHSVVRPGQGHGTQGTDGQSRQPPARSVARSPARAGLSVTGRRCRGGCGRAGVREEPVGLSGQWEGRAGAPGEVGDRAGLGISARYCGLRACQHTRACLQRTRLHPPFAGLGPVRTPPYPLPQVGLLGWKPSLMTSGMP